MMRVLTHEKEALSKCLCTKSRFLIINLNSRKYSLIVLHSKIWASNHLLMLSTLFMILFSLLLLGVLSLQTSSEIVLS